MKILLLRIWAGIFISIIILSILAFVLLTNCYGFFFTHPDWYPVSSTILLAQKIMNQASSETIESERISLSTLLERPIHVYSRNDASLPEIAKQLPPNGSPVYGASRNDKPFFYAPVHGNSFIIAIDPSFNLYAPHSSLAAHFIWLIWIFFVTAAGGFFLSRPISKRLTELESAADKIHRGDYSARIKTISSDLIGEVGMCFNQMADRIQTMVLNQQTLLSRFIGNLQTSNNVMIDHLNTFSGHFKDSERGFIARRLSAVLKELEQFVGSLLRNEKLNKKTADSFGEEKGSKRSPFEDPTPHPLSFLYFLRTLTGFKSPVFQTGILKFVIRVAFGILITLLFNHSYGLISSQIEYKYLPGIANWYPARIIPALIQHAVDITEDRDVSALLADLQKSLQQEISLKDTVALPSPGTLLEIESGNGIQYGLNEGEKVYFVPVHGGAHTLVIANGLDLHRQRPSLLLHLGMVPVELLFTVIGSILFSWPIIRNLKELEKGLNRIRHGDLDTRVAIPPGKPIGNLARSFNNMADRLHLLITNRKHLVQAVGHEIRTPVNRIHFHLEMMMHDEGTNALARRVDNIREDIEELNGLSEELQAFTEIEGHRYENEAIPIHKELLDILAHYRKAHPLLSITLADISNDAVTVHAYPVYFRRVIQNVLSNAIRHARSQVSIRQGMTKSTVFIEICDDGPGIPPQDRETIFEPFSRLDNSRNRETGGYGLGLAITRRILTLYHGAISVSDKLPHGAKFTIFWPLTNHAREER